MKHDYGWFSDFMLKCKLKDEKNWWLQHFMLTCGLGCVIRKIEKLKIVKYWFLDFMFALDFKMLLKKKKLFNLKYKTNR